MSHRIASQRAFEVLDPQNEALMGWETWSELLMEVDPSLDMTQIRSLPMPYTHPHAQTRPRNACNFTSSPRLGRPTLLYGVLYGVL